METGTEVFYSYHDVVDLEQLEAALKADGRYHILTCTCGEEMCASRPKGIEITHLEERCLWRDLDKGGEFSFSAEEARENLRRHRSHLLEVLECCGVTDYLHAVEPYQTALYLQRYLVEGRG